MGRTPRERITQIPMPTRSSEAGGECFGRTVLTYLREDEQADASFFILGEILHNTIEWAIRDDVDLDTARDAMELSTDMALDGVGAGQHVKITGVQRGWDTMMDDGDRMIQRWFDHVHPDGEKRHPIYDDYEWPPQTEVQFYRTDLGTRYPVWGKVDALFTKHVSHRGHDGETHMIVDWKSGVKRPEGPFQLNFYRFGMREANKNDHYHMLDRVRKPSIVVPAGPYPGDGEIKRAISLTERRKDAILKGYFPKFTPDWYCNYCPVQHLCPVDGDPRNRDENRKALEKLLQSAEAMEEIEEK